MRRLSGHRWWGEWSECSWKVQDTQNGVCFDAPVDSSGGRVLPDTWQGRCYLILVDI